MTMKTANGMVTRMTDGITRIGVPKEAYRLSPLPVLRRRLRQLLQQRPVVQVVGAMVVLLVQIQPVLHQRLDQPTVEVTNARLLLVAAAAADPMAIRMVIPMGMAVLSGMRSHVVEHMKPTTLIVASADRARRREMR